MKLSAPKVITWWIALILAGLGFIGHFVNIPVATMYQYWFVLAGYVLLMLGTLVKGL